MQLKIQCFKNKIKFAYDLTKLIWVKFGNIEFVSIKNKTPVQMFTVFSLTFQFDIQSH